VQQRLETQGLVRALTSDIESSLRWIWTWTLKKQ
jgi:hypothetical protein